MPKRTSSSGDVGKRAAGHPEYEQWMKAAAEAEGTASPEDAMEHLEDVKDNFLYLTAKAYWLRRSIGADASGFSDIGEHLKKPQELAVRFKVTRDEAEDMVKQAHDDVDHEIAEMSRKGMDFHALQRQAEREIRQIETRLGG